MYPLKEDVLHEIKSTLKCYLCKDCCSHKTVYMKKTNKNCLDVIELYAGSTP